MNVVVEADKIVITLGKRIAQLPFASEGDVAIVSLDEVSQWHQPPGEEISLADLSRLTTMIEKAFEKWGRDVEFE